MRLSRPTYLLHLLALLLAAAPLAACSSGGSSGPATLTVRTRSPILNPSTRPVNGVVHSFTLEKPQSEPIIIALGSEHTAGTPVVSLDFETTDNQTFTSATAIFWPGPGLQVHLVALDATGTRELVNPLFRYDLCPAGLTSGAVCTSPGGTGADAVSSTDTADGADVGSGD